MDCRAGGHARVRGAAAFDGDHGLATPKVVRGNVPNQPRLVAGLAVFNATVGDRGAVQSAIEMQDAALAARIEVQTHTVADLDRRLGLTDTAIEEATKRGKTNTALSAMEAQRRARASIASERNEAAGPGRSGWSPLRNSSFASPEYRFEFIFERSRRKSQVSETPAAFRRP